MPYPCPMKRQSLDTSLDVERLHTDLLRKAGPAKRFEMLRSLSATVIDSSREALRRREPDLTEDEILFKSLEHLYGKALAERVRCYMDGTKR